MADANSAYTLADIEHLKQLDDFYLMMIEQPLAHDEIIDHAAAAGATRDADLPRRMHPHGASRRAGDPHGRLQDHQHQAGARRRIRGSEEGARRGAGAQAFRCGAAACWNPASDARTTSRSRRCRISCCPATSRPAKRYWKRDIIEPPVEVTTRGTIVVRDEPGFGYELDMAYLDEVCVRRGDA